MFKKKIAAFGAALILALSLFASESAFSAYVEGCQFYAESDWTSAKIMLKKAVSYSENFNPDVYYMLITAEVYDGDEKSALDDCDIFLSSFPESSFYSRVKYHKGRLLYNLGDYDKAIIELSDFCHQYLDDELYSYALFYIGESLFAGYKYDEANGIFERIVQEFPNSDKAPAAQYRIDTILQRGREEKLLYLLKQTGEEYLSAKEEYEKQMKMYNSNTVNTTQQKLADAQARNNMLEKQVSDLREQQKVLEKQLEELNVQAKNLEAEKLEAERIAQSMEIPAKVEEVKGDAKESEKKEEPEVEVVAPAPITTPVSAQVPVVEKPELIQQYEKDVPSLQPYDEAREQLRILKRKALEAQKILEERNK